MLEINTIYLEDCLEGMKKIDAKSVDMICCDLPYQETQNKEDIALPFDRLWGQYLRIIKDNGCIALFGQGLFYIDLVNSQRDLFRYDLVWDKTLISDFLNANRKPLRRHEQIAIFYKKQPTYNPQFTEGNPLHGKGTAYKTKNAKNQNYGEFKQTDDMRKGNTQKYPTTIVTIPKSHPSKALHRTEKPVKLIEWLIKTYTNENELVLDNCIGCGTTAIACKNIGRNFIGFEINEEYYKIANERLLSLDTKGGIDA